MNRYEVTLYETIKKTLVYEIKARGEKEAKRKALRDYKYEDPEDKWITGWNLVDGEQVILVETSDE